MSPKNTRLALGFSLSALVASGVASARADEPEPRARTEPQTPASAAPAPSAAAKARPTVLLLTNGRVLQGTIVADGSNYALMQRGGVIRFPKSKVEQTFGSMRELFEYKRARTPERDPDEVMKLARWCLNEKLNVEARETLNQLLVLSPRHQQAKSMLGFLDAAEETAMMRDNAVVQTSGVQTEAAPARRDDAPEELNPQILSRIRREMGVNGPPVIFDLPAPLAVKRAEEFRRVIHPIVQFYCAKCHDERYQGSFQLVRVPPRRPASPDVLRSNLDAVLSLVDPNEPSSNTRLLANALLPHGNGANKRPILRGPNDPAYQALAKWVDGLRSRPRAATADAEARQGTGPNDGFGADRHPVNQAGYVAPIGPGGRPVNPLNPLNQVMPKLPPEAGALPPGGMIPGSGASMSPYAPPGTEFPLPFTAGGRPKAVAESSKPAAGASSLGANPKPGAVVAPGSSAAIPPPKSPAEVARGAGNSAANPDAADKPAPGAAARVATVNGVPFPPPDDLPPDLPKSKKSKKSKLGSDLLQNYFQNRNAPR